MVLTAVTIGLDRQASCQCRHTTATEGQDNPVKSEYSETIQMAEEWAAYLFHRAYRVHLVDFGADTLDLDTDVCTLLDNLVCTVCPLRRRCIPLELDIRWNHLAEVSMCFYRIRRQDSYVASDKSLQRAAVHKEA